MELSIIFLLKINGTIFPSKVFFDVIDKIFLLWLVF